MPMPDVYGNLDIAVSQIPDSSKLNVQLDWPAEDGAYYFVEHTEDLLEGFGSIKLFAGSRANPQGKLGLALQSTAPMGFYRLFITDDESHPRLLADDDGDKISNLLEAQAGWDAYEQPADLILDTDNDGLPDYWEQFHFGNLDQDGAGDPDGDGILNRYEWEAATAPTIDQTIPPQSAVQIRPDYAVIDLGEGVVVNSVGNKGHVLYNSKVRWYWGQITNLPYGLVGNVKYSDYSVMNNNGDVGGSVSGPIDGGNGKGAYYVLVQAFPYETPSGEQRHRLYTRVAYFIDKPFIINADGEEYELDTSTVSFKHALDSVTHSYTYVGLNDLGDYLMTATVRFASASTSIGEASSIFGHQGWFAFPSGINLYSSIHGGLGFTLYGWNRISVLVEKIKNTRLNNRGTLIGTVNRVSGNSEEDIEGNILQTPEHSTEHFINTTTNTISYKPVAINHNDLILGYDEASQVYSLHQYGGTGTYALPTAFAPGDLTSPDLSDTDEALMLISKSQLAIQKTDPETQTLKDLSLGAEAWQVYDFEDVFYQHDADDAPTRNEEWESPEITHISDNGAFLAVKAKNATTGIWHALLLLKVDIAVDADRNGEIEFGSDQTEEGEPYVFWVNNDADSASGEDPGSSTENHADSQINGIRDLEDFTRLHIDVSSILPMLKDDSLDIALKFENTTGSPGIKLWAAKDADGGIGYLEDTTIAQNHLSLGAPGVVNGSTPYVVAQQYWDDLPDGTNTAYLLYEGSGIGKGELTLEIQSNGQALGDGPSVWLELRDIKTMYMRGKADWPSNVDYPHEYAYPNVAPPEPNMGYTIDSMGHSFDAPWYETGETIVFVHGWNQPYENSIAFAETGFKRLWHRGFTGRYAMFRWPTFVGNFTYNDSDYRAWKSGQPLKQFVESLPGTKNIMAHSMGNIVTGSALKQGLSVSSYALINAAVPAACYDSNTSLNQWSYTTPDTEANLGFRGYLENIGGNLINFYVPNDFELWAWTQNNSLFKPQRFNPSAPVGLTGYYYDPAEIAGKRLGISFLTRIGRFVNTPHESMAYVAQSQTRAVGAEGNTSGSIDMSINLATTYNYADDAEHSGPWNYPIQEIYEFYRDLLASFGIETP